MIAAERGKERVARFLRLAPIGRARFFVLTQVVAAFLDAVVVTSDIADFSRLGAHFPGVTLLAA